MRASLAITENDVATSLENAMKDPGDVFARPNDVLHSAFSKEEQRKILRNWDDLLTQRQTATAEGMTKDAGEETADEVLQKVRTALTQLDEENL
jgi:hypothetical protein